jgi:Ca-activated chloride channel homolog
MKRLGMMLLAVVMLVSPGVVYADDKKVQVTQVDNSRYPEVTIYVSVTDASGQVVSGLQQTDFKITEDGIPVAITGFRGGDQVALATVLVIDRSGSMDDESKLIGAKQAAATFVDLMRAQDQAALVSFSESAQVNQPFTADKAALKRAITALTAEGGTAWYDGVYEAVSLFKSASGRRAIILLSDGLDNQSRQSLDTAIKTSSTAGIPVYAIGLGNQPGGSDPLSQLLGTGGSYDEAGLKRVAEQTDGKFYHAPTAAELKALYESLAVGMQHDYAITYRSPRPTNDGTRRNIDVAVGGATGGSQYLETHLLNIRSDVITGLLLILPLLAALIAPLAFTKRRASPVSASPAPTPYARPMEPPAPAWTPPVAPRPTPPMPPAVVRSAEPHPPAAAATCLKCGAPLRADARFCAKCGTPCTPAPIAQPAPYVCPHCRKSLRPGAKFCNGCGAKLSV